PIAGCASASWQPMLISRCSSGAARVSPRLRMTPVYGDTNDRSRGSAAVTGVGGTGLSSSSVGNRDLLVPRQGRSDAGDGGAGRTAGDAVDVVDGHRDRRHQLDRVHRRRRVVVAEDEPA